MASYFVSFVTIILLTKTYCFMIPPQNVLESTILSTSSSPNTRISDSSSVTWQQPKFNEGFTSYWHYWQSTPNIHYGTVTWIFNKTHMYYYFNIPSLNIQYHQYITNETYYLWTQNNTNAKINCFKYKFPFHIINDYFKNSSFAGLTDDPDIQNPTNINNNIPITLINMVNTTDSPTLSPTMSPTLPPSNSPTNSPTNAPTHSPTKSPTKLPTKEPTHSPTRAPTDAPTQSPTQSPTRTPTNSPTSAPNMYPIQTAEAIWIGYLYTERIFGRNMSYIVTANQSGFIGHLYITLNSDDINLEKKVTKSDIMWLKNISWSNNNGGVNIAQNIPNIPPECNSNPINTPTFSPTISPTVSPTGEPSMSPTIAHNLSGGGICSLPQPMIILYVILITFFILLLFCWYARKNNMMTRIMNGDEQSLAISSDRYHSKYKSHYNGNKIKKMNNKSESRSKY
eukprot:973781_1